MLTCTLFEGEGFWKTVCIVHLWKHKEQRSFLEIDWHLEKRVIINTKIKNEKLPQEYAQQYHQIFIKTRAENGYVRWTDLHYVHESAAISHYDVMMNVLMELSGQIE